MSMAGDALHLSHSLLSFSSCPQSFPISGSFPMSQLFTSDVQSIRASASVLPMNIQGWFTLGLMDLISLLSKGLSRVFSSTTVWKHQFFGSQPSLRSSSHICTWLLEKHYIFDYMDLCQQMISLLFTLSRFVTAFLPRSKHLLILCLQLPSGVILEPKKIKSATLFIFPHLFAMKWWDQMPWP